MSPRREEERLHTDFSSSRLVRLLAPLAPAPVPPASLDFAERLGLWLGAFDALRLQAAQAVPAAPVPGRPAP